MTGASSAEEEERPEWEEKNDTPPLPQPASSTADDRSSGKQPRENV